jgi:hypothetical protein
MNQQNQFVLLLVFKWAAALYDPHVRTLLTLSNFENTSTSLKVPLYSLLFDVVVELLLRTRMDS